MTDRNFIGREGVARRAVSSVFLCALLLAGPAVFSAAAQETDGLAVIRALEQSLQTAIARAEKSVVAVARVRRAPEPVIHSLQPFPDEDAEPGRRRTSADPSDLDFVPNEFGAGVIVASPEGGEPLILTTYHLVKGGSVDGRNDDDDRLYVRFPDRRGCEASIIAADRRCDLAVLRPHLAAGRIRPDELQPIEMGDAENLRKGTFVITLGNPYAIARDGQSSAGWGIVSNLSRRPAPPAPRAEQDRNNRETLHHFGTLLQIDARLNLGSSGGAVVDLNGRLLGVLTSMAALEGYEKSVGYAIPLDQGTRRILDALLRGYEVEYGFLGVQPASLSPAQLRSMSELLGQTSAAVLQSVFKNSPAERGGLRPGDVILSVNGRPLHDQRDLVREIGLLGPEAVAKMTVWRDQRTLLLTARLGKWPVEDEQDVVATKSRYPAWRGIDVDYSTARLKFFQFAQPYLRAVVVTAIDAAASAATQGRLQAGDFVSHVDGKPVDTPAEFHRAVQSLRGEAVRLTLVVDGRIVEVPE